MMDIRTFQEQTAAMCRAVDAKRGIMLLSYFATLSDIDLSVAVEENLTADIARFGVAP